MKKKTRLLGLVLLLLWGACGRNDRPPGAKSLFQEHSEAYLIKGLDRFYFSDNNHYYDLLNNKQKEIYTKLFTGMQSYAQEIKIPQAPIDEVSRIYHYILYDHPILFYVGAFEQITYTNTRDCTIKPQYYYAKTTVENYIEEIIILLEDFYQLTYETDYHIEKFFHDYCLEVVIYDSSSPINAFNILGVIYEGKAVCEGITKFMKLALDFYGVKNILAVGTANDPVSRQYQSHAWNIVYLQERPYHLDVTFDLTLTTNMKRYDYFNLNDHDIYKDHQMKYFKLVTSDIEDNYFYRHNLLIDTYTEFEQYIVSQLQLGTKNFYFKINNESFSEMRLKKILDYTLDKYVEFFHQSVQLDTRYNETQMVFELEFR